MSTVLLPQHAKPLMTGVGLTWPMAPALLLWRNWHRFYRHTPVNWPNWSRRIPVNRLNWPVIATFLSPSTISISLPGLLASLLVQLLVSTQVVTPASFAVSPLALSRRWLHGTIPS